MQGSVKCHKVILLISALLPLPLRDHRPADELGCVPSTFQLAHQRFLFSHESIEFAGQIFPGPCVLLKDYPDRKQHIKISNRKLFL